MFAFNDYKTDSEKVQEFFIRNKESLIRFAIRMTGDIELANDLMMDCIHILIENYDKVRDFDEDRLRGYSMRIISNRLYRIKNKKEPIIDDDIEEVNSRRVIDDSDPIEERVEKNVETEIIKKAIERLKEPMKTIIVMKYYFDAPDDLVAPIVGVKKANIKMMRKRAKDKLRKIYLEIEKEERRNE